MWRLSCCIIILSILTGCRKDCIEGEGPIISENLFAPYFDEVELRGSFDVFIEQDDDFEVRAVGHRNIVDRVQLDETDDRLSIGLESDCFRDFDLTIYISMPEIRGVHLEGSGDIRLDDFIENDGPLSLEIDGSGDIRLESVEGTEFVRVDIDGSGDVRGSEDFPELIDLEVDIDGSGDYYGFDIIAEHAWVEIDGSGDCRLHVTETLDVEIDGSGDVFFRGNPVIISDISGSGDIIDAN